MAKKPKILIIGGGSAGWMSAALLSKTLGDTVEITLVESSQIGTVGVGEGSTPKICALFDALGIDESEWMPTCNATYKAGIRFQNWSVHPGYESYFHGFYSHFDRDHIKALKYNSVLRRARYDVHAHPDLFLYNSYLAERQLSPVPPESFPFDVQYAYHFDAALLGEFLKQWSMKRGVGWRDCRIKGARRDDRGAIAAVVSEDGECITADIFVDCSGFGAFLIEKELGAEHISYGDSLFNDAAVAIASPPIDNPHPMTTATTMNAGWAWHIPLQSRTGNGYVYSTRYLDADAAEAELRAHIGTKGDDTEARHLPMRVGRLNKPWIENCVAVGLSQGFIEPLEATGLALAQFTLTRFVHYYLEQGCTEEARSAFNAEISAAFDGVRDFVAAHFLTASRDDTDYWRDVRANRQSISANLQAVFDAWRSGEDLEQILQSRRMTEYFSLHSWYYLLSGKGIYPYQGMLAAEQDMLRRVPTDYISDFLERCTLNHQTHGERLAKLSQKTGDTQTVPDRSRALDILLKALPYRARPLKTIQLDM